MYLPTSLHDVTAQENNNAIFAAVETSNFTQLNYQSFTEAEVLLLCSEQPSTS